jgi:hypothetical protein
MSGLVVCVILTLNCCQFIEPVAESPVQQPVACLSLWLLALESCWVGQSHQLLFCQAADGPQHCCFAAFLAGWCEHLQVALCFQRHAGLHVALARPEKIAVTNLVSTQNWSACFCMHAVATMCPLALGSYVCYLRACH